jgi:hypothetical protein
MLGVAQEKAFAWRGWRDGGSDAHPHFEFARQAIFVNHHYWYIRDAEWGPSFLKTNAYAPYPVWVYLNGHAMLDYLAMKAATADLDNVETALANAVSLPLADGSASLVVSNYCCR